MQARLKINATVSQYRRCFHFCLFPLVCLVPRLCWWHGTSGRLGNGTRLVRPVKLSGHAILAQLKDNLMRMRSADIRGPEIGSGRVLISPSWTALRKSKRMCRGSWGYFTLWPNCLMKERTKSKIFALRESNIISILRETFRD